MKGFPRRFGPYALAKPLARGGMGALYLAVRGTDAQSRVCVIKTVLPHLADKEYLQRFRDEGKVVVQLTHENLVPVFDSGQVGGEIYLGMNFIDGKDLRAVWNRCAKKGVAFPMDVAVFIVRELARGLTYAHTFGNIKLVHRDISPPNVLLSYDGSVKLTDFGLASSTLKLEKTAPGIIYGKVSYMSPEQARGEPLDGRTDQFAAGIILWELLTGRQLYPAKPPLPATAAPVADGAAAGAGGAKPAAPPVATAEDLLRIVRNPQILAPSKRAARVPAELDRIALRALAPQLADRYPSCAEFADELSAYLAVAAPATNSARVAKFLTDLYADDIVTEQAERDAVLSEARTLLRTPFDKNDKAANRPISSLTMPIAVGDGSPGGPKPLSPGPVEVRAKIGAAKPPPLPGRRSGRETIVGGPVDLARERHADEISAAFADSVASGSMLEAPSSTVLGTLVAGRYSVRRLRGEGGMGRVYEAEHIEIGKRVALKILHPGYSQTPDLVERLRREARAASRIGHPNVVDVTDSGTTDDGAFFFVMEYLEGRELGEIIFEEKGLELRRAIGITLQICRALQAAHKAGVIHRDLKPENVLLVERDGQKDFVKVLDFGIAKNVTEPEDEPNGNPRRKLTNPGVAMGTPEYMAPEQAAGRPADVRSDVYAVGGLLYEMLAGRAAYEGANFMEILHKKANQAPAPISGFRADVPPEIEDLVKRTMATDPAVRPQSMEDLERELNEIAWHCLPAVNPWKEGRLPSWGIGMAGLARMPGVVGAGGAVSAVWDRLIADRRRLSVVGAAAFVLLSLAVFGISRSRANLDRGSLDGATIGTGTVSETSVVTAAPVSAPAATTLARAEAQAGSTYALPPGISNGSVAPESTSSAAVAVAAREMEFPVANGESEAQGGARTAPLAPPLRARGVAAVGPSANDATKMLGEAEQLLRAQRFGEAREGFTKLTKTKRTRGRALVALAEIAFQEKNYEETIRSATLAANRGGGARARVLLGDAHFRLNHFSDAAAAYGQALRLEPDNPSAKSGLALASKRM